MRNRFKIVRFIAGLFFTIQCFYSNAQSTNVLTRNGNVWLITNNGAQQKQLTFSGKDTMPVLSWNKKYVAFIRNNSQIWMIKTDSNASELLVQAKPDSLNSLLLGGFDALQFSIDDKYLYFLSNAWATSMAIHRIDLATGRDEFISDGNSLYIIPTGKGAGDLVVLKHKYRNYSGTDAYDSNWLLTPDGKELQDLGLYKKEKGLLVK